MQGSYSMAAVEMFCLAVSDQRLASSPLLLASRSLCMRKVTGVWCVRVSNLLQLAAFSCSAVQSPGLLITADIKTRLVE
jgi:hypothetical protein